MLITLLFSGSIHSEKLPRYDIDVENMFPIPQTNCTRMDPNAYYSYQTAP